jgi:hypothetical protein
MPPGCEAELCPAGEVASTMGFAPGSGSARMVGPQAIPGAEPNFSFQLYGGAEPRLTSGGTAVCRDWRKPLEDTRASRLQRPNKA